jgi:hypothetical protein
LWSAGNVLATKEVRQMGQLLAPGQFMENAAQMDEPTDVGDRRQRWSLRVQLGQPTKDMWITAQLIESTDVGIIGFKIDQEVADCASVVTA